LAAGIATSDPGSTRGAEVLAEELERQLRATEQESVTAAAAGSAPAEIWVVADCDGCVYVQPDESEARGAAEDWDAGGPVDGAPHTVHRYTLAHGYPNASREEVEAFRDACQLAGDDGWAYQAQLGLDGAQHLWDVTVARMREYPPRATEEKSNDETG